MVVMVMVVVMGVHYHDYLRLRRKRGSDTEGENQSKQNLFHTSRMTRWPILVRATLTYADKLRSIRAASTASAMRAASAAVCTE
jgi:hypothetical protein